MSKSRKKAIKELKERIDYEIQRENWKEALVWERKLIDTYHWQYKLREILKNITFSNAGIEQMKVSTSVSSLFLVGYMLCFGRGGVSRDNDAAYECLSRAADLGHIYALCWQGLILCSGWGFPQGENTGRQRHLRRGMQCLIRAAEAGCIFAAWNAGIYSTNTRLKARYYAMAARQDHSGYKHGLSNLLRNDPMGVAPFSDWKPDSITQMTVPDSIHQAMYTSLVYFRTREQFPKYVCNLILFYICTRNGWNL